MIKGGVPKGGRSSVKIIKLGRYQKSSESPINIAFFQSIIIKYFWFLLWFI
jgi:hypothetical protein